MNHARYVRADIRNCSVRGLSLKGEILPGEIDQLNELLQTVVQKIEVETPEINPIRRLMAKTGMNIKEFAEYFKIPYRTVQNWAGNINDVPTWAPPLFEMKLLQDKKM